MFGVLWLPFLRNFLFCIRQIYFDFEIWSFRSTDDVKDFFFKQFAQHSTVFVRHPGPQLVVWSCRAGWHFAGRWARGGLGVCVATPLSSVGVATPAPAVTLQGGAGARGLCCIFLFLHLPAIDCRLDIAAGQLQNSISRLRYYSWTSRLLWSNINLIFLLLSCLKPVLEISEILTKTTCKWLWVCNFLGFAFDMWYI